MKPDQWKPCNATTGQLLNGNRFRRIRFGPLADWWPETSEAPPGGVGGAEGGWGRGHEVMRCSKKKGTRGRPNLIGRHPPPPGR